MVQGTLFPTHQAHHLHQSADRYVVATYDSLCSISSVFFSAVLRELGHAPAASERRARRSVRGWLWRGRSRERQSLECNWALDPCPLLFLCAACRLSGLLLYRARGPLWLRQRQLPPSSATRTELKNEPCWLSGVVFAKSILSVICDPHQILQTQLAQTQETTYLRSKWNCFVTVWAQPNQDKRTGEASLTLVVVRTLVTTASLLLLALDLAPPEPTEYLVLRSLIIGILQS